MIVTIRNKNITINDNLVKCAEKYHIEVSERYCKRTLEAMLTPGLERISKMDFDYEFSIRTDKELSNILSKAIVMDIDMNGGIYDEWFLF